MSLGGGGSRKAVSPNAVGGHYWGAWERAQVVGEDIEIDPPIAISAGDPIPAARPAGDALRILWRHK
mgnify:CR=1 FL=1